MDKVLPNFSNMGAQDATIYGSSNVLTSINPYKCHFVAEYPDGKIIKGNNLFNTGWDNIPNGLSKLCYVLSTGHVVVMPKFKAYLPLIECSYGMDGSRVFHCIKVKCLADNCIVVNKIILKSDRNSKFKIGDVIIGKERLPDRLNKSWKFTV